MPEAVSQVYEFLWVIKVFGVVLVTLILNVVAVSLLRRLHRRLEKTKSIWDDTLIDAAIRPFGWIIWVIGLAMAAEFAAQHVDGNLITRIIQPTRNIAIIFLVVWFFIRFIRGVEHRALKRRRGKDRLDETSVRAICQLIRAAVVTTAILIAMQTVGVPISGVLAFGGFGGLAIGFAAKDLLGNFFGGLMIFLDRPFKVGDWINSPDKEIEGTVEQIGWRLTRIRAFDKRPLYVPNGLFSNIVVRNPSRMTNRRIYQEIGLRYDDATKMATILSDIEKMLREHPEIDTTKTLMVNLIQFSPSALTFMIYTFTKTTEWVKFQAIQQDVFLKVIEIITGHGAEVAFPTSTVHLPDGIDLREAPNG
jgi:MscS family membrane protein